MVGESLEQHCLTEFNRIRMTAFPMAYFEKDNDARTGSKGDFIFRESAEDGTEFISIMFEMKNEMDETASKHKNEDFFKELDLSLIHILGLFYPPDPGEKESTLAGNISTNAGGMRAVKYGVTRDYVRGLEIVLADGQVMTVGSKNVKDASGLPLKQLFIGAEGTLGVITKCVLRLVPKPEKSLSVLIPYGELKTGIASVHAVLMADALSLIHISSSRESSASVSLQRHRAGTCPSSCSSV